MYIINLSHLIHFSCVYIGVMSICYVTQRCLADVKSQDNKGRPHCKFDLYTCIKKSQIKKKKKKNWSNSYKLT